MTKVFVDMGISLDGFVAGPNRGPKNPLGDGGTRIHQWMFKVHAWRERQSRDGGARNRDNDVSEETFNRAGAYIMGRRMFDEGEHSWPDPPPFRAPVFVLTNEPRSPWERQGGTTFYFITDGSESALRQAREAAGEKDVHISGGAHTVQQFANAGLIDDIQLHLAPILLGDGLRLLDGFDPERVTFHPVRAIESDEVTHVKYSISSNIPE